MPDQFLPSGAPSAANTAIINSLTKIVPNPFAGNCTGCTGPLQSGSMGTVATVKQAQLILPFPQFDGVAMAEPDNRDSIYHSMQLKVQKRFSAGAQVLASYTVSKLIDNTNSEINWLEASPVSWNDANPNNLRSERSLDAFDVPRSEEHTSELQSRLHLVCRLLLEKKKKIRCKNSRLHVYYGLH